MRADERDEPMTAVAAAGGEGDGTGGATAALPSGDPRQGMSAPALEILAAAQRLLVAKGFAGLTLRAIARRVGRELGDGAVLLREQGRPRQGDDRLGLPRRPGGGRDGHGAPSARGPPAPVRRRPAHDRLFALVPRLLRHAALRPAQRRPPRPHGARLRVVPATQARLAAQARTAVAPRGGGPAGAWPSSPPRWSTGSPSRRLSTTLSTLAAPTPCSSSCCSARCRSCSVGPARRGGDALIDAPPSLPGAKASSSALSRRAGGAGSAAAGPSCPDESARRSPCASRR